VVCADSRKTSLKLRYLGTPITNKQLFGYGSLTLCGPGFQLVRLQVLLALAEVLQPREKIPRFSLIRFRSPLLTESLSLSFPLVTEMFHFTRLRIFFKIGSRASWVTPFGDPRVKAPLRLFVAYRSLARPSSLIGTKASIMYPYELDLNYLLDSRFSPSMRADVKERDLSDQQ
jgi:hypothetical protein